MSTKHESVLPEEFWVTMLRNTIIVLFRTNTTLVFKSTLNLFLFESPAEVLCSFCKLYLHTSFNIFVSSGTLIWHIKRKGSFQVIKKCQSGNRRKCEWVVLDRSSNTTSHLLLDPPQQRAGVKTVQVRSGRNRRQHIQRSYRSSQIRWCQRHLVALSGRMSVGKHCPQRVEETWLENRWSCHFSVLVSICRRHNLWL